MTFSYPAPNRAFLDNRLSNGFVLEQVPNLEIDAALHSDLTNLASEYNLAALVLGGSRAYGTHRPDSDTDVRGFFLEPSKMFLGLDSPVETVDIAEPDMTLYEVGKFFKLALSCNPNVIEQLYGPVLFCTPVGQLVFDNRQLFLSQLAIKSYGGYAMQQMRNYQKGTGGSRGAAHMRREKYLMHLFRLMEQGFELLATGNLTLQVKDPQRFWDIATWPMEEVVAEFERQDQKMQSALVDSVLPVVPDKAAVGELLQCIRLSQL